MMKENNEENKEEVKYLISCLKYKKIPKNINEESIEEIKKKIVDLMKENKEENRDEVEFLMAVLKKKNNIIKQNTITTIKIEDEEIKKEKIEENEDIESKEILLKGLHYLKDDLKKYLLLIQLISENPKYFY
jgi:hypothetical protein